MRAQCELEDTQVENLCYGMLRGAARAREPGSAASEARMAKRSRRAASEGQDARSERPATGMGSPEPDTRACITCEPFYGSGTWAGCIR